jgi:hypothetical protein
VSRHAPMVRNTLQETVMNHSRLRQPLILQRSFVEPYAELIRRKCLLPLEGSDSCRVIDIEGVSHGLARGGEARR